MKFALAIFLILGYLLAVVAYFAHPAEIHYVSLPAQDGPEHYPEMSRDVLHANSPSLDVDVVAGEVSPPAALSGDSPCSPSSSRTSPADPSRFEDQHLREFMKRHPNGPYRFIPLTAKDAELRAFELQAKVILSDWEIERDRLLNEYGSDIVSFSKDARTLENDRSRQQRLRSLVISLWPQVRFP